MFARVCVRVCVPVRVRFSVAKKKPKKRQKSQATEGDQRKRRKKCKKNKIKSKKAICHGNIVTKSDVLLRLLLARERFTRSDCPRIVREDAHQLRHPDGLLAEGGEGVAVAVTGRES